MLAPHRAATPKCALIVGHPGHELRVFGWIHAIKPLVAVLTDGSGNDGQPRIDLTTQVLRDAGATLSQLYGFMSDRAIYRAVLARDLPFFLSLADRLTGLMYEHDIELVASDAIEGYNPTHDLCCLLTDHAVRAIRRGHGKVIHHYAFPLAGPPRPDRLSEDDWCLSVAPDMLACKLASIREYAGSTGGMLVAEVRDLQRRFGEAAFAEEVFHRVNADQLLSRYGKEKPFYETHGARRVAAGKYQIVIRYQEHIAPIADALAS